MVMPGRSYTFTGNSSLNKYRFGFNGQERETELNPSITSAEYWMYDGRLGRRWNVDPVLYPWNGGYTTFESNPIIYSDPNGDRVGPVPVTVRPVSAPRANTLPHPGISHHTYYNPRPALTYPVYKPGYDIERYMKDPSYARKIIQEISINSYARDIVKNSNSPLLKPLNAEETEERTRMLLPSYKAAKEKEESGQYLYRFDTRSPEEIIKAGGFESKGFDMNLYDHALGWSADESGYISTTKSENVANDFSAGKAGYIYTIKMQKTAIDVNAVLGARSPRILKN